MGYATSSADRMSREEAHKANRGDTDIVSWVGLWQWARDNNLPDNKADIERLFGHTINGLSISSVKDEMQQHLPTSLLPDNSIDFASTRGRRMEEDQRDNGDRRVASLGQPVTPRQLKFIQSIARSKGMSDDELNAEIERTYGKATVAELDRRDASAFIDRLQARRPVTELSS